MLQDAVTKIPKEEAEYHIKRCIDSGLWVPGGGTTDDDGDEDAAAAGAEAKPGSNETAAEEASGGGIYSQVDH